MALCEKNNYHPQDKKLEHSSSWLYSSNKLPWELNDIVSIECKVKEEVIECPRKKSEEQDLADMQQELDSETTTQCLQKEEDSQESEYQVCYRRSNTGSLEDNEKSGVPGRHSVRSYICSIEERNEDESEIKTDETLQFPAKLPLQDVLYELSSDVLVTENYTRSKHLQTSFKMAQRYRHFFSWRRPSDITDLQSHSAQRDEAIVDKCGDKFEMDPAPRRHSDNFIERQKRNMNSRLNHLRELWNERVHTEFKGSASSQQGESLDKGNEVKEVSETSVVELCEQSERSGSTLLVFRPLTCAEDNEKIIDALRDVVRKSTSMNPMLRPTSSQVYSLLRKAF